METFACSSRFGAEGFNAYTKTSLHAEFYGTYFEDLIDSLKASGFEKSADRSIFERGVNSLFDFLGIGL